MGPASRSQADSNTRAISGAARSTGICQVLVGEIHRRIDTGRGAAVLKWLAGADHEVPAVVRAAKHELEDAVGAVAPCLAIGPDCAKVVKASAARAHDEFPNAPGIGLAIGILRRETLVVVIVAVDNHVDTELVEHTPDM